MGFETNTARHTQQPHQQIIVTHHDRTQEVCRRMRRLQQFIASWRQSCIHRVRPLILHIMFAEMAQDESKGHMSNVSGAIA